MNMEFLKDKKYFIGGFLLLILILGVLYFTQKVDQPIEIKFDERGVVIPPEKGPNESYLSYSQKIADLQGRIKEMMEKDDFGGETPEETLQLFIDALKAGKTELASRYFVVNKREQMAKELAVGTENGGIEIFLEYVEKIVDSREIRDDLYRFTVAEGDKAIMSFDLIFNEHTNVWKIESL